MATVTATRTGTSIYGGSYRSTWTFAVTCANVTASGSTFQSPTITCTSKYVQSGMTQACSQIGAELHIGSWSTYICYRYPNSTAFPSDVAWNSGATKTLVSGAFNIDVIDSHGYSTYTTATKMPVTLQTADVFTSANKTQKTVDVAFNGWEHLYGDVFMPDSEKWTQYDGNRTGEWDVVIGSVTLNVPPTVTTGTPTHTTLYAGVGTYTVPITQAEAYYDGDVSTITLTVGANAVTKSYSSSMVSNETISITPSNEGTFTPTITVTDSRGQTTTEQLPSITVNAYDVPSVNFDVYRVDSSGVKDDEGHYGLIEATFDYTSGATHLVEPTVKIDGTNVTDISGASVTWYSASPFTSATEISDWGDVADRATVYGLIDANYVSNNIFSESTSYQVTLIAEDEYSPSQPITQTLSTAFYTIDFRAGGKEIAFGAPANDVLTQNQQMNGLFKCGMESQFNNPSVFNDNALFKGGFVVERLVGEIKAYAGTTVPTGWLECNGTEVLIADYPLLFNAIGTSWGTPSDSDHFVLPNLKGRVLAGYDSSQTEFDVVGETGGAKTVKLTDEQMAHGHGFTQPKIPAHKHSMGNIWSNGTGSSQAYQMSNSRTLSTRYTNGNTVDGGGGACTDGAVSNLHGASSTRTAHNNLQPYAVVKYIICAA